ncbi:MAG: efflux RND transporter periplasmic adaptor subunit, partial [bacterium]
MREKRNRPAFLSWFTIRGQKGFVLLALALIAAFVLGGLLRGNGENPATREVTADDSAVDSPAKPTLWTCSMHPQIKLPNPGKCPICHMDLIPLETSPTEELGPRQLRLSETAKQLAHIETTPAQRAFAEANIRLVGKIEYDETKLAYITAWVPGRLDRLYADFTGIRVNKGDHMVYMYSPELLAAQEELLQARAAVKSLARTSSSILRDTAQSTLDAARGKLRLFGLTTGQIQSIETSGKTSDHLTIYAPVGGVVVQKDAKEGMYVSTGTRIYTIADLSTLWVMFEAYESDLPWLRYG